MKLFHNSNIVKNFADSSVLMWPNQWHVTNILITIKEYVRHIVKKPQQILASGNLK